MKRRAAGPLLFVLASWLAGACAPRPAPTPTMIPTESATSAPTLIPPDADTPAAGICGEAGSEWATFVVSLEGPPDPRCWQVRPHQRLEIVNPTGNPVVITFAGRELPIEAGASHRIDEAFGSYLAPGVHFIFVTQGSGNLPEFWLLPE